jgi:hypothetical protein
VRARNGTSVKDKKKKDKKVLYQERKAKSVELVSSIFGPERFKKIKQKFKKVDDFSDCFSLALYLYNYLDELIKKDAKEKGFKFLEKKRILTKRVIIHKARFVLGKRKREEEEEPKKRRKEENVGGTSE